MQDERDLLREQLATMNNLLRLQERRCTEMQVIWLTNIKIMRRAALIDDFCHVYE